jgi:hypothetical protein
MRRTCWCARGDGDVLRGDGGARCDPSADGAGGDEQVARDLIREMAWYDAYLERGGVDRSANPSPGNKRGGLTNIVEKALGSIAKAGTSAIAGVFGPGRAGDEEGADLCGDAGKRLHLRDAATGRGDEHAHVFTTGRGTPYGLAMVAGDQGVVADWAKRALARLDRSGRRDNRYRRRDHRAGGDAIVRVDSGCGERAHADLGGPLGSAQ